MTRRRFLRTAAISSGVLAAGGYAWARSTEGGRWHGPASDHFDGERFFNSTGASAGRPFTDLWKWKRTSTPAAWPKRLDDLAPLRLPGRADAGEVATTFVGHSTFLLQFSNGVNVLTDPVWSERVSPVSWTGPKRVRAPGIPWDQLPPVHLVLVSHGHYDHMDIATLRRLEERDRPQFLTALGHGEFLRARGLGRVEEFDWWKGSDNAGGTGLRITLTPAQHWSARGLGDRNRALWGGFFLDGKGASGAGQAIPPVWFAGDTGYAPGFCRDVRKNLGAPALALLPIGAYEPRWFMRDMHMNPDDAVCSHLDVGSRRSVGMHFGTFQLTDEAVGDPVADLAEARTRRRIADDAFTALRVGETRAFGHA